MTFMRCAEVTAATVLSCWIATSTTLAQAQTAAKPPPQQPARAAVNAAAASSPASAARGFGNARGPILTRDELRACLSQEGDLKKRLATQEAGRAPLEQDKKSISDEQALMRGERAKLESGEFNAAAAAFTERTKAFSDRVARLEARVKAYNDAGRSATEAERDALTAERAELERERLALEAERKRLQAQQAERLEATQAFNVKIRALDAKVVDWNQRNNAWNDANALLESERTGWVSNCGNRRYREEDEIAIRSGK